MRSIVIICLLSVAAFNCNSQSLPADLHSVGHPSDLRMHWRLRPHGHETARWGIVWNFIDSLNYDRAEIELGDERYSDTFGREAAALHISRVREGEDSLIETVDFCPASPTRSTGLSLRLRLDPVTHTAMVEAGSAMAQVARDVEILTGTRAGFYSLADADTLRMQFECTSRPEPKSARYADVEALRAHLAATHDVNECEWTYYDRNTDPQRVSLGGDYRLATLADGAGGYDIVYLGGARDNAADWEPMRIKGHLSPTGFIGQFDLEWIDAEGMPMAADSSALITDGMLLELRFPLYKSSVRYRRTRPGE
ncbi:MAG: hypothetical protein K2M12_07835 [Muribaculaceae bacterium]|nr:hypothetical protein [Muribaculaceae bacterium]